MSLRRAIVFFTLAANLAAFPMISVAQGETVCQMHRQSSESIRNVDQADASALVQGFRASWHDYQQAARIPESKLTYADRTCLTLWYGTLQGIDPSVMQAAGIPFEPDLAWMVLDARLSALREALREPRAQRDSEWKQSLLQEQSRFQRNQGYLRPNFVSVEVPKTWVPTANGVSPLVTVRSRAVNTTLVNLKVPLKLFSKSHELVWEGEVIVPKLEPRGGKAAGIGQGKRFKAADIADVEIGDVQFSFEHREAEGSGK